MKSTREYRCTWSTWDTTTEVAVSTWADVEAILDRIGDIPDPPPLVEVWDPETRRSIGIGLGRPQSVVTYQESLDPPYYISLGDPEAEGTSWFCYGEQESEQLGRNLIPIADARRALRLFVEQEGRPDNLDWERL